MGRKAGVSGEKVIEIADEIDNIFHKNGYVVSHDKIAHFVVDCIRENSNAFYFQK